MDAKRQPLHLLYGFSDFELGENFGVSSHSAGISSDFTPLGDTRKLEGLGKISFLFPVLPCQKAGTLKGENERTRPEKLSELLYGQVRKVTLCRYPRSFTSLLTRMFLAALSAVVEMAGLEPTATSPPD